MTSATTRSTGGVSMSSITSPNDRVVDGVLLWPRDGITLHTANPSGRDAMRRTILRYAAMVSEVSEVMTAGEHRTFRFRFAPTIGDN